VASLLIPAYTGILTDADIGIVAQIYGIPLVAEGGVVVHNYGIAGPSFRLNYDTQRALLFEKIEGHEANVLVESEVSTLVSAWRDLPLAGTLPEDRGGGTVASAQAEIQRRMFALYGVLLDDSDSGELVR